MKTDFWVRVGARKSKYSDRWEFCGVPHAAKKKPACSADEIAFKLELDVPDTYFERSGFAFKVTLPDRSERSQTAFLDAERLGAALEKQIGMRVSVSIEEKA